MKIEVGDKLIVVKNGGNASRRLTEDQLPPIYEGVVIKKGRKYFTVSVPERGLDVEFRLDNLWEKTKYSPDYSAHSSKQAYVESLQVQRLYHKLKDKYFSVYGKCQWATMAKIKAITEILEADDEQI